MNYTGSLGGNPDTVPQLHRKYGTVDVESVLGQLREVVRKFADCFNGSVVLFGGSHGGFLAAWLAARLEGAVEGVKVTGAIIRNPVTDYRSMLTTSDIPDYVPEAVDVEADAAMTSRALYERSPISAASMVTCPVLLLLGSNDRRVPHSQGLSWFHSISSREKQVLVFEDCHGLAKASTEAASIQAIRSFLSLFPLPQ